MINTETLHDAMRERRAYRGVQLALYVLEHADGNGVYEAPSKAHVRRLLARGGDEEAKAVEVDIAVRQLISSGVLAEDSTSKRFVLAGSRADSVEVAA